MEKWGPGSVYKDFPKLLGNTKASGKGGLHIIPKQKGPQITRMGANISQKTGPIKPWGLNPAFKGGYPGCQKGGGAPH